MTRFIAVFASLSAICLISTHMAQAGPEEIRIAVMADMSGPFSDIQGPGDVVAVRMAVEDFGGKVLGKPIKVLQGDHLNKADIGANIARRWIDVDKVDIILGLGNSAVALAVQEIAREKHVINIATSVATSDLTQAACSPYGVHWVFDSYALAKGAISALTKQGKTDWFLLSVDYNYGHAMERDATSMIKAANGRVLGSVRHPLNTQDFSSYLLQAQSSRASVIGFANAGGDLATSIKQASEFRIIDKGRRMVAFAAQVSTVHAIGLKLANGLMFVEAFYWDQNDATRAFSKRFEAIQGRPPTMLHAGIYGAAMHYLKAVQAAGTDNADAVMQQMRKTKINDFMTKDGWIREDGRVMRDMFLLQAKAPEQSKGGWDLLNVVATIPAEEAFRPLSESTCPLVKR
jgi:branched-chain amino acid transport system substrate-binding protein